MNDDLYYLLLQVKARFKQLEDEAAAHKASSAASHEQMVGEDKNGSLSAAGKPVNGDGMDDGTVYAGLSPDTGRPMYTTPEDAPLTYTFNQAKEYASALKAHGHRDWRVPAKGELNVLFNNRATVGGFDIGDSPSAGWYASSTECTSDYGAWTQRFSDGKPQYWMKAPHSSLRCVRG